jgi:hypothetical protein
MNMLRSLQTGFLLALSLTCCAPDSDADSDATPRLGSYEPASSAAAGAGARVAVTTQPLTLYSGPPIIQATFTRPMPVFLANGDRNMSKAGSLPDDLRIRDQVHLLSQRALDVVSKTDLYFAAYDWDQYWNSRDYIIDGVRVDLWDPSNCGASCCHDSTGCCSPAGCPGYCKADDDYVQGAIDRNLEIKAIFNAYKGKPPVQAWLTNAIAAKKARGQDGGSYEGVSLCTRGDAADCEGACLGNSTMHAKFVLARRLSNYPAGYDSDFHTFITSTNFDYDQLFNWNDAITVSADQKLYDGMVKYFEQMVAKSSKPSGIYYPKGADVLGFDIIDGNLGLVRAYLFPRNEWLRNSDDADGRESDVIWRILDDVRPGSTVLVALNAINSDPEGGRGALLKKLRDLDCAGSDVRLIVSAKEINDDTNARYQAIKNSVNEKNEECGVRIFVNEAKRNYGAANRVGVSMHHKFFLTSGKYAGQTFQRLVFAGTQNWTNSGLQNNDEIMFKVKECERPPCEHAYSATSPRTGDYANNRVWIDYARHWNELCKHSVGMDATVPGPMRCEIGEDLINIY